jgi:hypothetical protein
MIEARVSRRNVVKFSALGAAVVALPLERAVRAKTVSQIVAGKLPTPCTLPFAVPPVIDGRGAPVADPTCNDPMNADPAGASPA